MSKSEKNAFFSKPSQPPILISWNLILNTFLCTKIKKITIDNIFSLDACLGPMWGLLRAPLVLISLIIMTMMLKRRRWQENKCWPILNKCRQLWQSCWRGGGGKKISVDLSSISVANMTMMLKRRRWQENKCWPSFPFVSSPEQSRSHWLHWWLLLTERLIQVTS